MRAGQYVPVTPIIFCGLAVSSVVNRTCHNTFASYWKIVCTYTIAHFLV